MTTSPKKDLDRLVLLILGVLRQIHTRLTRIENPPSQELFSPVQWQALHFVKENKKASMRDLADYLCVTPPSATSLTAGLVNSKFLKRNFDKADRRTVRLTITAIGQKTMKKEFERISDQMKKVLLCLDQKEQKQLISIYKKVLNSLINLNKQKKTYEKIF